MPSSTPRSRAIFTAALVFALAGCGPTPSAPEQGSGNEPAPAQTEPSPSPSDETGEAVPVIASDEATFDFGTIAPSESVTHVFKLVNRGRADLHIEKVERT